MECYLCTSRLYRHEIRDHILEWHKQAAIYQCGRCDYVTADLRVALVEHITIDHGVTDPLCENVHFRHLSCGELMKRMTLEAPGSVDSDQESLFSLDIDNIPSPDSACPDLGDSRGPSPVTPPSPPTTSPLPSKSSELFIKPKGDRIEELVAERSPDSGVSEPALSQTEPGSSSSTTRPGGGGTSDLEVGQVVWVWMSGYPIWPGLIAPAPEGDKDAGEFMRRHSVQSRLQYHCQFFGSAAERCWINSKAILPWEETMSCEDQFVHLTKQLVKVTKSGAKARKRIKFEVPKAKKESWDKAVQEAEKALANVDFAARCDKMTALMENKVADREKHVKETKKGKKRKSILPSSLTYKMTPHKELAYVECNSTTYDAELHIPEALWSGENHSIPAEIVTGPEFYASKFNLHSSRIISKDMALRACTALKLNLTEKQLSRLNSVTAAKEDSKEKENVEPTSKEKAKLEQVGSKCEDIPVCMVCEETDEGEERKIVQCDGVCKLFYHVECDNQSPSSLTSGVFTCLSCQADRHPCFMCNHATPDTVKCAHQNCGRFYHPKCLELDHFSKNGKCPLHSCHTCTSRALVKSVNANESFQSKGKMFQCIRCPAAYHYHGAKSGTERECIPAGSLLVGGKYIVCPAHFQPRQGHSIHQTIHVNQCFKCFQGGELVICDRCPAAFHEGCLEQQPSSDGAWYCESCSKGHQICYNDIVWVKMGQYRWWPSEVIHPTSIPANLECMPHGPGEFVTRFLGTNEYYWVNQRRCFAYRGIIADPIAVTSYNKSSYLSQDSNSSVTDQTKSSNKKGGGYKESLKKSFTAALIEAEELYDKQQGIGKYKANGGSMPFTKLSKNAYYPSFPPDLRKKIDSRCQDLEKSNVCDCHHRGDDCSEFSDCENRGLLYECGTDCKVGADRCKNRKFTKKQYPSLVKFKTPWGGFGIRAKEHIAQGTFIIEYCGEIIDQEESRRRLRESGQSGVTNYYILALDKDRLIDAGPRGNLARFINHSCAPNCYTEPWQVNQDHRVGIFAKCDLAPGEELTFNYQLEQHGEAKTKCLCGAAECTGFIGDKVNRSSSQSHSSSQSQSSSFDPSNGQNGSKSSKAAAATTTTGKRSVGRPLKSHKMKPLSVLKQAETNGKKRGRPVSSSGVEITSSSAKRRKL